MKALLFDLDGTLTHTDPLHFKAIEHLLKQYDRDISEELFKQHVSGHSNVEICAYLFPEKSSAEHIALANEKERLFRELAVQLTPMPGLEALLARAARDGIQTGLVTNAPSVNVEHMLAALKMSDRFDVIVLGEELARAKPGPLPYLTALEALGAEPLQALVFEDSLPGIRAGAAAGICTFGIMTTLSQDEILAAGAHFAIMDFTDVRIGQVIDRQGQSIPAHVKPVSH
ncbi:MAG: HAD family phosphatase [Undibacterium sp.]|uniref:HAD family hydrolase n=1 Tax=Undibacterium sp. TaxID=1914977 RepID=UPI00271716FD|nr:HAD family phosphatase [Undibacterium sp.]MDO8654799.1 HAD family phosphatase [Undibacterium sp.]